MLIDTHTHLQLVNYNKDRKVVIQRALDAGVKWMVNISFDIPSSQASITLAEKFPFIKTAIGVHPHEARNFIQKTIDELIRLASSKKVIAVGEIGLDYYRDLSPRDKQEEAFRIQMEMAKELDLPVIIHTREAYSDLLKIVEEEEISKGVLHCFSGNSVDVKKAMDLDLYFGIGGMLTFKTSNLPSLLKKIPKNRLLLETDCPFLTPRPHKGRNEPSYLTTICEKVSAILDIPFEDVAQQTSDNAKTLFGI
jgi:TatD DNase family protein